MSSYWQEVTDLTVNKTDKLLPKLNSNKSDNKYWNKQDNSKVANFHKENKARQYQENPTSENLSVQTIGYLTKSFEMETIPQTLKRVLGQFHWISYTLKFSGVTCFQILVLDSHQTQTLSSTSRKWKGTSPSDFPKSKDNFSQRPWLTASYFSLVQLVGHEVIKLVFGKRKSTLVPFDSSESTLDER